MTTARQHSQALAPTVFAHSTLARDAALVVAGSLAMAALAQVQIPLQPVPITGQTLGVFLVALTLGARLGGIAVGLYLLEGALGLPVLAGLSGGIAKFAGPTSGFLIGFLIAAVALGWLADRGWTRQVWRVAAAMLLGTALIYLPGLVWLSKFTGPHTLEVGLYPFLLGDALKAILAAVLLPVTWKLSRH